MRSGGYIDPSWAANLFNMQAAFTANAQANARAAFGAIFGSAGPVGAMYGGGAGAVAGGVGGYFVFGSTGGVPHSRGFALALGRMAGHLARAEAMGVPGLSSAYGGRMNPLLAANDAIGRIMATMAIPGARPGGAGGSGTGGANKARKGGGTDATNNDDPEGKARRARDEQRAYSEKQRRKQEARQKELRRKDAKTQLDAAKRAWKKELINPKTYGYTPAEADAIIKLVMDNIETTGDKILGAKGAFDAAMKGVPRKKIDGQNGKKDNPHWKRELADWVATQRNAKTPGAVNLAVDPLFRVQADVGKPNKPKLRRADYARILREGVDKDSSGNVYDRYRVTNVDGKKAKRAIGSEQFIYHRKGKWYIKKGDKFVQIRRQPKPDKFNAEHGTLNFGKGKLVFTTPRDSNLDVQDIINMVKPTSSSGSNTGSTATKRLDIAKRQLAAFFGPWATVEIDGNHIKITPKDKASAAQMIDKLKDPGSSAAFARYLGNVPSGSSVRINGQSVTSAAGAISALKQGAVKTLSRAIDIRQPDPNDSTKDKKVDDPKWIANEVDSVLKSRKIRPSAGTLVIPLRFANGKKPDQSVLDAARKKLERDYRCKVRFSPVTEAPAAQTVDRNNPKHNEFRKLILAYAGNLRPTDAKVERIAKVIIEGSPRVSKQTQRLPRSYDQAIVYMRKALVNKARNYRRTLLRIAKGSRAGVNSRQYKRQLAIYKAWYNGAKDQLIKILGPAKAKMYDPAEIEKAATGTSTSGTSGRTRGRNRGGRGGGPNRGGF